ncbi:hypothetical protein A2U01_0074425, partial [Trifolium medium]|nr:hypothetical protein [Trifolium medium]
MGGVVYLQVLRRSCVHAGAPTLKSMKCMKQ